MNLLLDISHPAYAHALQPFMHEMKKRGHTVLITARNKDLTQPLLTSWGFSFISKGKGYHSLPGKLWHTIKWLIRFLPEARNFNPDMVISFSSWQAAILGRLLKKEVITLEDTEHVSMLHRINRIFSTYILTPFCFEQHLGKKHIRFAGYKELASLHPNRFTPDQKYQHEKPYILLRFVSWQAWHDRGHAGMSDTMKGKVIRELSAFGSIYISSELPLPEKWKRYALPFPAEHIHSFMAGAQLIFGESASMAAEAAVLGIPAIFIDNTGRGYTRELEQRYDLLYNFGEADEQVEAALQKAKALLKTPDLLNEWQHKRHRMLQENIDVTQFLVDFVENRFTAQKQ